MGVQGAAFDEAIPVPFAVADFARLAREAIVLDTQFSLAFGASHLPNALSIWSAGLPSFAVWFLPHDQPILLVNDTDNPAQVARYLLRLGYRNIGGFLSGDMLAWHMAGR